MQKTSPLIVEHTYDAPPEQIWQALTDPGQMKKWYFDLPDFRAEVGNRFQFEGGTPERSYLHLCEVKSAIPNQKLAYSWRYDGYPGDSLVSFELFAEGEKTRLRLTHAGLEPPEASACSVGHPVVGAVEVHSPAVASRGAWNGGPVSAEVLCVEKVRYGPVGGVIGIGIGVVVPCNAEAACVARGKGH